MKSLSEYIDESFLDSARQFKEKILSKMTSKDKNKKILYIFLNGKVLINDKYYSNNTPTVIKQIKNIFKKYTKVEPFYKDSDSTFMKLDLTGVDRNIIDNAFDEVIDTFSGKYKVTDNSNDTHRGIEIEVYNKGRNGGIHDISDRIIEYVVVTFTY